MCSISDVQDIETITNTNTVDNRLKIFVKDFIKEVGSVDQQPTSDDITKSLNKLRKKYKISPSKTDMRKAYEKHFTTPINYNLEKFLIKRSTRSISGVLVSTVVLKPDVFSCPKKCSYCPTETNLEGIPTQPKSYLSTEPAMLRALEYNFDVRGQIWNRINAYINTGNIKNKSDDHSHKMEIILSGGTWESYPYDYRNQVITEVYWSANTFGGDREMLSLEDEIRINETAKYRIIGLTLETRPDFITKQSIKDYRRWGVTRIQIGVQHYDDNILTKINRECYTKDTIRAIKLLKQTGFKVVCHLMPDLPGSSPELDKWMFNQAINNPDLQFDDVKVYPTAVCQSNNPNILVKSDISDWYKAGLYTPYAEKNLKDLIDVLKYYKSNIQPWVRIQRLIRDIPKESIESGYEGISNLRQVIQDQMKAEGTRCNCIRCLEVGHSQEIDPQSKARLIVRPYIASEGLEYYISIELYSRITWSYIYYMILSLFSKNTYWKGDIKNCNGLLGFCRLRIDPNPGAGFIKELKDCALIREVHVYGRSLGVGSSDISTQHKGYGKLLVKTAEEIASRHNFKKVAVIAGVGTREYYKNKCEYHLEGTYMVKSINSTSNQKLKNILYFLIINIIILFIVYLYWY